MIRRQKIEALVLSRRNIGEADRLVTFFTRKDGIIKAVAKGVRKIPSARGGHLEPFTRVLALVSESRAGWYVSGAETQEYYNALKKDEQALAHARNSVLVFLRLFDELDPQPTLYDAFLKAWEVLPQLPAHKRQVLEGATIMLALREAGLLPDLKACQLCGTSQPSEAVILDAHQGGWRCLLCHQSFEGTEYSLSPRLLKAARFLAASPYQAPRLQLPYEEGYQLLQALRRCVADVVDQKLYAQ